MAVLELRAPERHGDSYAVTLDESVYEISWSWNARSGRWWMRLSDDDGQIVYIPVVGGLPLLRSVTGERRPPGELLIRDRLGQGREPGLRDFTSDFVLLYVEESDIPEGY